MAIPNIMNVGHSGLTSAKAGIATTGHNISNANVEGYSRQRVISETAEPRGGFIGHNTIGNGTRIARVERINDEYIEKQLRSAGRDVAHFEEKELSLSSVEDVFNEMGGEGLNRLVAGFFNEFRKLADEPENIAIRQSVREATQAVVNDFHRLRREVQEIREHVDSRIEGFVGEMNSVAAEVAKLNIEIATLEVTNGPPNDLLDKRDLALKKLATFVDTGMHKDKKGNISVDIKNVGPWVTGAETEKLSVDRTPADHEGKPTGALDVKTTGNANGVVTHRLQGGKLGALISVRDKTVSTILNRLDDMAFCLSGAVNEIHRQGISMDGKRGIDYFKPIDRQDRAAEVISLSDPILTTVNNMATAIEPDSPGDNRIALGISKLQNQKIMEGGYATLDEWYNSIVSDVGVASARNRFALSQQKDIVTQLDKVRDQISGVSIDEETTNLLQYQHVFDASAKVIQIADELLKTVLAIKQ